MNWYNEIDRKKAAWLRELIHRDVIAPGVVDERSVDDVSAAELAQYTQCHFFAGIGIWSYALRLAGWPDDRPVWSGSCPCSPFSAAGKRKGKADKRHLWPSWFRLIAESRPSDIFAEQVASRDGLAWLDDVYTDLEGAGYAVGAVDLCSAGFGAPHIRQRLYIVANASSERIRTSGSGSLSAATNGVQETNRQRERLWVDVGECGATGAMADAQSNRWEPWWTQSGWRGAEPSRTDGQLDNTDSERCNGKSVCVPARRPQQPSTEIAGAGAVNGFWRDAEWLWCRDEKYRPTKPGLRVLVARTAARILRLCGYGDGLTAPVAAEFIKAHMSAGEQMIA